MVVSPNATLLGEPEEGDLGLHLQIHPSLCLFLSDLELQITLHWVDFSNYKLSL